MKLDLVKNLYEKKIINRKGNILRIIKKDSKGYKGFGEAYFTWINPGKIKGWKKHDKMILNLVVPVGKVKFVFFSPVTNKFKIIIIGENIYSRINVPPKTWFAFQCLSKKRSLVLNFSNIQHFKDKINKLSLNKIKFNWE